MKVDWDELKGMYENTLKGISQSPAPWPTFCNAVYNAFPAILAERQAAQEFRDVVAGLAICDVPLINQALAAFDKESKND